MRSNAVVGILPDPNYGLCLPERVEDLLAQALVLQLAIEALTIAILPRRSWCNVLDLRAGFGDPFPQSLRDHFWAVVAADVVGDAMQAHRIGQRLDHTQTVDAPRDL